MPDVTQHNFHVPMPGEMYRNLRAEAVRRGMPATALARQVIEEWLETRRRLAVAEAITTYAAEVAGTQMDLDPELEAAAVEALRTEQQR